MSFVSNLICMYCIVTNRSFASVEQLNTFIYLFIIYLIEEIKNEQLNELYDSINLQRKFDQMHSLVEHQKPFLLY